MRLLALRLHNVRRFAGRGVAIERIGDGVNVLCARNEFGKSTSFEALHALFFQLHSSVAADVKALRPYSGGSPLVEADIDTAGGRFRIAKQFFAGRSARVTDLATGRLVAQADEAEAFIADLVRGGTAGPAGLLWVRQGLTGIETRSRSEEDRDRQVRAGLLESVQGEVEAVTGGRRMADVMARTQAALAELVTPTGRPKAGGRYDAAIRDRDALAAREARLGADVEALRADLDGRARTLARLAELDRGEASRREQQDAIAKAEARLAAARMQAERLRAAEGEERFAQSRLEGAERDLAAFRAALSAARRHAEGTRDAERRHADSVRRQAEAAEAADEARRAEHEAEREAHDARDLLARLDAALRARDSAGRLGELAERLAGAEAAQRLIEEREAQHGHLAVPAGRVEELQALEIEIARARAAADAGRPTVAIAYAPGAQARIAVDGVALGDGETRGYGERALVEIAGVGVLTLRAGRSAGADERAGKAEVRRAAILREIGVSDLSAARKRQSRAQALASEVEALRARLSALAPAGLPALRRDLAAHRSAGDGAPEIDADPDAAADGLRAAEARRRAAREAAHASAPLRQRADDAFVEARTALARLEAEGTHLTSLLGPEAERAGREADLLAALDAARGEAEEVRARVSVLRAANADPASAEATLRRLRSVEKAEDAEAQALRETLAGLTAQIRARSDEAVEESWRECREALGAAQTRVAAFEREVGVLSHLSATLGAARLEARDLYLRPVMDELKPLLGLLFEDAAIAFDDRTLLPGTLLRGGVEEEVERLSGGMREQLSILTRLAFARLLARDGRPAPVILDDALVYSDDDRIERMFDALHRQSGDQQIIVFSCRQRAFQRLGGNVLQMTDWQP